MAEALGLLFHSEGAIYLLGQWLTGFKLFGITYLVGKIEFKLLFQGPLAKRVYKLRMSCH